MEQDETVYIDPGHICIELEDGETLNLQAGSMASFSVLFRCDSAIPDWSQPSAADN